MNNLRLLAGLLCATLLSGGVCAYGQSVVTLEDIFESAETNSAQLRPSFTAQTSTEREISVARSGRQPDINASLSLSYAGDGFTTDFVNVSPKNHQIKGRYARKRPSTAGHSCISL